MTKSLCLEYACTHAEMQEAQELNLRKQIGGGSKWRTRLILLGTLGSLLLLLYYRVRTEVSPAYRQYIYLAVPVFCLGFLIWKRRSRKLSTTTTRIEVNETGLAILGGDSNVRLPWSAVLDCLESPTLFVLVDRPETTLLVIPKRVFPDEERRSWFRVLANNRSSPSEPLPKDVITPSIHSQGNCVVLQIKLGIRDYIDRTLASWRTWGILLVMVGVVVGGMLSAANPPPDAVHTTTQSFLLFVIPFLLMMVPVLVLIISYSGWSAHTKHNLSQELVLSEEFIAFSNRDAVGRIPWNTFSRYKETRWSFILWKHKDPMWTMLPKRMFKSSDDLSKCRLLLSRNLRPSRWFLG